MVFNKIVLIFFYFFLNMYDQVNLNLNFFVLTLKLRGKMSKLWLMYEIVYKVAPQEVDGRLLGREVITITRLRLEPLWLAI